MTPQEFIAYRQSVQMSQKEIAALLGVTFQCIQFWERGARTIPRTTCRLIRLFQKFPQLIGEF
jgi:DNA-binding transcriptional regulator YiaG